MELVQVGIDHHLAPLAVREHLALSHDAAADVARALHAEAWADEVMILATCNRTEAYVASPAAHAEELVLEGLLRLMPTAPAADADCYRKQRGVAAALHLVRVASGLESAILGETEIQGQVRQAHARAQECGTIGPVLERLAQAALRAGRRARTETSISAGGVSHGTASVQVVERVFDSLAHRMVLIVGAGQIATQAAHAFDAASKAELVIANRTAAHADLLVAELSGGRAVSLDDLGPLLGTAHVAVFATGTTPTVTSPDHPEGAGLGFEQLAEIVAKRREPLVLIDLGLPRTVDTRASELPGVFVFDLEDLEALVAGALAERRDAIPAAEVIVGEELTRFRTAYRRLAAAPTIRTLREWAELVRAEEAEYAGRDMPPEVRAVLERMSTRIVDRLLGRPAARVARGAAEADPSLPTAEHLRHVFGLDETEDK